MVDQWWPLAIGIFVLVCFPFVQRYAVTYELKNAHFYVLFLQFIVADKIPFSDIELMERYDYFGPPKYFGLTYNYSNRIFGGAVVLKRRRKFFGLRSYCVFTPDVPDEFIAAFNRLRSKQ